MADTERMELISPKTLDSGKTIYRKVGVAWPRKNGPGWTLELEMYPLPDKEGRTRILMMPPRGDAASAPGNGNRYATVVEKAQAYAGAARRQEPDDEVPF